ALAYRGTLSFELSPSVRPFQPSRPAIELTGGDLGSSGAPLLLRTHVPPPATFNSFAQSRVVLSEQAGWTVVGEARAASAQEIRSVLGDLQDLRIIADSSTSSSESIGLRGVRIDRAMVRVVIAAGQSNMSGCANQSLASWDFTPRHDLLFWHQLNDAFEPLTFGSSDDDCNHVPADRPDHFGPEIGFAHAYLDLVPDGELVLIKFTDGGTSMGVDWAPPGTISDLPDGGLVYQAFYQELDAAFAELDARGYDCTVEGTIWMQGESDAGRSWQANYHDVQLPIFIDNLRSYIGNAEMPYIIGRIADNNLGYDDIVRQTQVAIANTDPFACWVDTDDLTKLDLYHYDEASTLLLGQRFAEKLRRLTTPRGDANLDGVADVEDVYHWHRHPSDENCDGVTDSADLEVVMASVRGE
ncbi:MAG: sialate O-acetylesterase, partial [Planctomycetota bacterium]